jgi:hypothetical protein
VTGLFDVCPQDLHVCGFLRMNFEKFYKFDRFDRFDRFETGDECSGCVELALKFNFYDQSAWIFSPFVQ